MPEEWRRLFRTRRVLQARIPSLQLLCNELFCSAVWGSPCSRGNTKQMAQNSVRCYSGNKLTSNNNDTGTWSRDVRSGTRFLEEETCFKPWNLRQLVVLWECNDKPTCKKILWSYKLVDRSSIITARIGIKDWFKFSASGGNNFRKAMTHTTRFTSWTGIDQQNCIQQVCEEIWCIVEVYNDEVRGTFKSNENAFLKKIFTTQWKSFTHCFST